MRDNSNHPWRAAHFGALTIDPVVSSRSGQFAAHLETLSPAERQQIEIAERAFVRRAKTFTSPQRSTARDYAVGMLGVKENEPAKHRGFVV